MRAVLDPNVLISALLSPSGAPAQLLRAWQQGRFELIVSTHVLQELRRALGYQKLRRRIAPEEAADFAGWLTQTAETVRDPASPPTTRSADPGDDYLLALAEQERAALVSGDDHLLALAADVPVFAPAAFLRLLDEGQA